MAPAATETTEPLIVPPVWADAVAANDRDNSAIAMPSQGAEGQCRGSHGVGLLRKVSHYLLTWSIREGPIASRIWAMSRSSLGSGADRIVGAIRPGVRPGDADYAAMT